MYVRVKHLKVSAVKNKYYIKNTAGWSCTANFSYAFMASTVTVPFTFAYPTEEEWSTVFAKRVEKLQNNVL